MNYQFITYTDFVLVVRPTQKFQNKPLVRYDTSGLLIFAYSSQIFAFMLCVPCAILQSKVQIHQQ